MARNACADRGAMPSRPRALVFLVSSVLAVSGRVYAQLPAEDHVAELGVMFFKPAPELILSTDTLVGAGVNQVDFVQEFAIEEEAFPEFRVVLGREHKFRASFVTFDYEAEAFITRTIRFQGQTFNIGVPAATDITWRLYRFGYQWDFVSRERGFFGVVAELKYNRIEASVDSPALSSAATTDTTAPVPTLGVVGRAYIVPAVSITGEFTGLSLTPGDDELKVFDLDIYGMVSFGRYVGIQGGYRSVVADYVMNDDIGDLSMKGPYFGAVVKF